MSNEVTSDERIAKVKRLFEAAGSSRYGGEAISQLEHALQAAMFAEKSGAPSTLIAAALLHDIGHLLHALPDDAPDQGIDDLHEELGGRWLAKYFAPEVVEPVRLHVASKRYLCTADAAYYELLSGPSRQSLALQGGPMTADEARKFEAHPHFQHAVALRRWDEQAKIPHLETPPLEHYLPLLAAGLLAS
ncbi:phosphonate degradation operons associated HDIG domain protein [Pirellula staleyi DSM 6068]|uniref:Phosphonate degradation operons associated HDIG domain protein n=1 Tax=Pirellula staleyi (strain ATCC 27377 / DSM 6068 / ICPB 4128) TaxID=530564 RepID=D2R763_PIRSD|nr:phosphonate degradation HD-domain oxygenase [Pirellula staleyi]ADB19266.1 phosphonate degradation operons associated HDIG domain protein [Pirellula staleyi DSM 6068]